MRLTNEERLTRYKLALNHVAVIKLDVMDATPVLPPRKQLEYLDAAITALTEVREALANDVQGNGAFTSPPDLNIGRSRQP